MSTITRLALQAIVAKTAVFTGTGVLVSGVVADGASAGSSPSQVATLVIHMASFDAGNTARIQVTDSTDNFASDKVAVWVEHVQGGEGASNDRVVRIPWYDIPDARFGVTSAKMRVEITSISGGTLTYESWVEYS